MLLDYCSLVAGTHVHCSAASMDHHEPANLLANHLPQRGLGFRATSFTRSPVTIVFELPHPVNIRHLYVNPKVESHTPREVSLFVSRHTWEEYKERLDSVEGGRGRFEVERSAFQMVATVNTTDGQPFLFENSVFQECNPQVQIGDFSRSANLVLGHIMIVGQPAYQAHKSEKEAFRFLRDRAISEYRKAAQTQHSQFNVDPHAHPLFQANPSTQPPHPSQNSPANPPPHTTPTNTLARDSLHVDRRKRARVEAEWVKEQLTAFEDPITCEMMTEPMILPSGVALDRKTIERHLSSTPTDPYTGRPISIKDCVAHVALKARIDAFLLEYSNHPLLRQELGGTSECFAPFQSVGRTIRDSIGSNISPALQQPIGISHLALNMAIGRHGNAAAGALGSSQVNGPTAPPIHSPSHQLNPIPRPNLKVVGLHTTTIPNTPHFFTTSATPKSRSDFAKNPTKLTNSSIRNQTATDFSYLVSQNPRNENGNRERDPRLLMGGVETNNVGTGTNTISSILNSGMKSGNKTIGDRQTAPNQISESAKSDRNRSDRDQTNANAVLIESSGEDEGENECVIVGILKKKNGEPSGNFRADVSGDRSMEGEGYECQSVGSREEEGDSECEGGVLVMGGGSESDDDGEG